VNANRRGFIGGASAAILASGSTGAFAQKKYDDGVTDSEIKIGHCCPYSGPASAFGVIGKGIEAYWKMVNDQGGINGRAVRFITLDDGYDPSKTVEAVRQLVEREKVFSTFGILGTLTNTAVRKYLNTKKVPQLYIATGASKWGDPQHFPWTMGFQLDFNTEGQIYAKHIMANVKDAKIGILMQNDDFGKDYVDGFKKGLGSETGRIVEIASYELTDPTVDAQIIHLKSTGANVFFNVSTPKFSAMATRKAGDIGWKPVQYMTNISVSVSAVQKPAGLDNSQGIITAIYWKDPTDKRWDGDTELKVWRDWMTKYMLGANQADANYIYAYGVSALMRETLERCGDTLTRANLMKQATSFQKFRVPCLLPGITVTTSPTDYFPVQAVQLAKFKGETWELFGDVISTET